MPRTRRRSICNGTLTSPISRLPVELLSYVLILAAHSGDARCGDEDGDPHGRDISPCMACVPTLPDTIAAVSRHWRRVALSTPELWSRICITVGDVMDGEPERTFRTISRYLSRSGRFPLDILIDARDPEWDFSEYDSSSAGCTPFGDGEEDDYYIHPFSNADMRDIMNITLRSSTASAQRLCSATAPGARSAPLLESLVLMRCNEFASYSHEFSPSELRDPTFLPFGSLLGGPMPVLPRLKNLVFSGVHTLWSALPLLLPDSTSCSTGLRHLELSYHADEVRPSAAEFRAILERCRTLQELTIRISGPPGEERTERVSCETEEDPVALPHLTSLCVGYDDTAAAVRLLRSLSTPHLKSLTLQDVSHPAAEEEQDAGALLELCVARPGSLCCPTLFPHLETMALYGVKARPEALEAFVAGTAHLKMLKLAHMALPTPTTSKPLAPVPMAVTLACPLFESRAIHAYSELLGEIGWKWSGGVDVGLERGGDRFMDIVTHEQPMVGAGAGDCQMLCSIGIGRQEAYDFSVHGEIS
ncbi:hypothetical protein A0H81_01661 [Grifola frondosa]|uniref:Uncharacterized protein n=1 Tax=Grifola frondosa TaxID=5627 RepID=A0A1C7MKC6_GRIFR|nr:hypothetical protein A0H81_01661 [Grifola frondosa]